jgi:hypothetical protein
MVRVGTMSHRSCICGRLACVHEEEGIVSEFRGP